MKLRDLVLALSLVVGTCFGSLGLVACQEKAPTYSVGDKVDVEWKGSWWKAEVLDASDGKYKIHYVGWASSWDESVPLARMRARTAGAKEGTATKAPVKKRAKAETKPAKAPAAVSAAASAAAATAWKVGDKVDVEWNGAWWQGEILEAADGKYKIHYVGWAASWDESVAPKRLRARTEGSKRGAGK